MKLYLFKYIKLLGLAKSNAEAKRLIEQGAVDIDGATYRNPFAIVNTGDHSYDERTKTLGNGQRDEK